MAHDGDRSDRFSGKECEQLIADLFPQGFSGDDVLAEIAPEGWEHSSLCFVFHPTLAQVYEEAVQDYRDFSGFLAHGTKSQPEPEPTFEDVRNAYEDIPCDVTREVRELVAKCLWDVFSNEHDVVSRDGRIVHLGSFRGAAGFLADCLNRQYGATRYDYMSFYMGSFQFSPRANLTPIYEMIFRRLKARLFDWRYSDQGVPVSDFSSHQQREAELRQFDMKWNTEGRRSQPIPEVVVAYKNVYGSFPAGWTPMNFDQHDC